MKYTESEAWEKISRVNGVADIGRHIEVVRGSLGIKRLGALDFLVNHCKRRVVFVGEASALALRERKRVKRT